jgi:ATP-dependent Lon protease
MATSPISRRSLPQKPNAEYLRKEAKRLARGKMMQLAAARHQLAQDYGYRNWAALMTAVEAMAPANGGGCGTNDPQSADSYRTDERVPKVFPLLPLRGLVAFPHASYPIFLGRPNSIKAAAYAYEHSRPILLVTQRDPSPTDPASSDMYEVGTIANVVERLSLPDGTMKSVIEGTGRARVSRFIFNEEFLKAEAAPLEEPTNHGAVLSDIILMTGIFDARPESVTKSVLSAFLRERPKAVSTGKDQPEPFGVAIRADGVAVLADRIASESRIDLASKQALLEIVDPLERIKKLLAYLNYPVPWAEAERKILASHGRRRDG